MKNPASVSLPQFTEKTLVAMRVPNAADKQARAQFDERTDRDRARALWLRS
jgi:hypothetical protein